MAIDSSYNKPSVEVLQEFLVSSVPLVGTDLPLCIVGPAYQVEEDNNVGAYDDTETLYLWPDLVSGAEVDTAAASIVVKCVKEGQTDVLPATDYAVTEVNSVAVGVTLDANINVERDIEGSDSSTGVVLSAAFTDANADFVELGVAVGDKIYVSGPIVEILTVLSVTDENTIVLSAAAGNDQPVAVYDIVAQDQIGEGLGADILLSYRALRTDFTEPILMEESGDVDTTIGDDSTLKNPMGLACEIALLNGTSGFYIMPTKGVTYSDFEDALGEIENINAFFVVGLTMDQTILELVDSHCVEMSLPENKRERMMMGSHKYYARGIKVAGRAGTSGAGASDIYTITSAGANFLASNVVPGDYMYLDDIDDEESVVGVAVARVRTVVDNDNITVHCDDNIEGAIAELTVATGDFTRRKLAEYIRDINSAIEKKDSIRIWSPVWNKEVDGVDVDIDGFYACVAFGAAAASLPSQTPLTKVELLGFNYVGYSNLGFFKESDLNVMASGGVTIFSQRSLGSAPYCRHQLTTDMTDVKHREISVVKGAHYLAKYIRAMTDPDVGVYNITDKLFDILSLIVDSSFTNWLADEGRYGPKVVSAELVSMEQNETIEDQVDIVIDVEVVIPGNRIKIRLLI